MPRRLILQLLVLLLCTAPLALLPACGNDDDDDTVANDDDDTGNDDDTADDDDLPPNEGGRVDDAWWAQRTLDYLQLSTQEVRYGRMTNAIAHMGRELIDPDYTAPAGTITVESLEDDFAKIDSLHDTSDFDVLEMVYALNRFDGHPYVTPEAWERIRETVLNFKYWFTDPTPEGKSDDMWYWTDNHQAMFHTCEYLAGQYFKDEVFPVTGLTGAEHMERAKAMLNRWFEIDSRFGFREFHSNVYYSVLSSPILALAELAEDENLRTQAAMIMDLLLFDMALNTYNGVFGVAHGRSYKKDKMSGTDEDTWQYVKLIFDTATAEWTNGNDSESVLISVGTRYRPPQLVIDVAQNPGPMVDKELMSVPIDEEAEPGSDSPPPPGVTYDFEDLPVWWGASTLTPWQVLPTLIYAMIEYDLFSNDMFSDLAALEPVLRGDVGVAQNLAYNLRHVVNFGVINQANTYMYRRPEYMLAGAQDYRKGYRMSQGHSWQATFDTDTLVFTTHPGTPPRETDNWRDDGDAGAWTGTATMPRRAQHENVAITIYSPHYNGTGSFPGLESFSGFEPYTHAYFPQDHFDEVEHIPFSGRPGSWTFGKYGDGYIGLYSYRAAEFIEYDPEVIATRGMVLPFDLRALGGPDNVWIVEMGCAETHGTFEEFKDALLSAELVIEQNGPQPPDPFGGDPLPPTFNLVRFESPSQGTVEFGFDAPLTVAGEEIPITGYPRYDNPWADQEYDNQVYRIQTADGSMGFYLDFKNVERRIWGP